MEEGGGPSLGNSGVNSIKYLIIECLNLRPASFFLLIFRFSFYSFTQPIDLSGLEALEQYLVAKRFDLNKYEREVADSKSIKVIIDTTLLKCYLQNKPKMVASLLRWDSHLEYIEYNK